MPRSRSNSKPFEEWKTLQWNCRHCGWSGLGEQMEIYDIFEGVNEMACPICKEKIGAVSWPTQAELKENFDKLSPGDKILVTLSEAHHNEFALRKLSSPEQLPELPGESIVLIWDIERYDGGDTIIRYGDQVVWREPAFYEGYERFIAVAKILTRKYGSRLKDFVPSKNSGLFLYGDRISTIDQIRKCREKIQAGVL